jgi:hypothetical protein
MQTISEMLIPLRLPSLMRKARTTMRRLRKMEVQSHGQIAARETLMKSTPHEELRMAVCTNVYYRKHRVKLNLYTALKRGNGNVRSACG